jgi:hypothetical protein
VLVKQMKRTFVACAVIASLCLASSMARAQAITWGIFAGEESGTGALRVLDPGIAIGVLAQSPLSARTAGRLWLRTDVMFSPIGNNPCGSHCDAVFPYSYLASASFSLFARMNEPSVRWSPYAIVGATGYVAESLPHLGAIKPAVFGVAGGIGFEVRMQQHTLFAEARYMTISPGGVLPVTAGIRF